MSGEPAAGTSCSYCGTPVTTESLGVRTHREERRGRRDRRVDTHDLRFCDDDHAGRYFGESRLPAPDFSTPERTGTTWADRGYYAAMAALLLVVAALMALGASVVVEWLTG